MSAGKRTRETDRRRRHPRPRTLLTAAAVLFVLLFALVRVLAPILGGDGEDPVVYPANAILEAELVRVVDGDTIVARLPDGAEERIRYEGIDTPETVRPGDPIEPFGPEAAELNRELLNEGPLLLELDVRQRDRFGRLLAYVYAGDVFVNEALVRRGLAVLSTFPPNVRHAESLAAAQSTAREEGLGVWGE